MIILHASGGLDARNGRWSRLLQQQGYATFQLDYFGPRGVTADSRKQPTPVRDVAEALRLLASHPRVDPKRVAVIGFSRRARLGRPLHRHLVPPCRRAPIHDGGQRPPDRAFAAGGPAVLRRRFRVPECTGPHPLSRRTRCRLLPFKLLEAAFGRAQAVLLDQVHFRLEARLFKDSSGRLDAPPVANQGLAGLMAADAPWAEPGGGKSSR